GVGGGAGGGRAGSRLRRMLQSGDVRVDTREAGAGPSPRPSPLRGEGAGGPQTGEVKDEPLTAGQAARLLARAQATWGRQTYAAGPRPAVDSPEARPAHP